MTFDAAREDLHALADAERAKSLARFFKTGPGQYGEGDVFLGIRVPAIRRVARRHADLPRPDVIRLLQSEFHEQRLLALLILVRQYERGDQTSRTAVFDAYVANMAWINNWDLVDASAERIVGQHLLASASGPGKRSTRAATRQAPARAPDSGEDDGLLHELAGSDVLWERRIAVIATLAWIKDGRFDQTLRLARRLLGDPEDLIHKGVGWMLREIGKRDMARLEDFVESHHEEMPRTMLRYAIEHFPEERRRRYVDPRRPRRPTDGTGQEDAE